MKGETMATLADLKRKLKIGQGVKLVAYEGMNPENPRQNLNKIRYVVKVQSNGVYFNEDKTATKGQALDFPKATLLEADDKGFKIYRAGLRDLTEAERKIIDNEPTDDKQDEIDALSDGSVMYRRRKSYYEESGSFYLFGISREQGKRLTEKKNDKGELVYQIEDDGLKGEMLLTYEWVD